MKWLVAFVPIAAAIQLPVEDHPLIVFATSSLAILSLDTGGRIGKGECSC